MSKLDIIKELQLFVFRGLEENSFNVVGYDTFGDIRFDETYTLYTKEHDKFAKVFSNRTNREIYHEFMVDFDNWSIDFSHEL